MLPPVSAVSAVDISFQPASTRPENVTPAAAAIAPLQIEQEDATAGASAMARAVSGELRLAQNAGVLAETLGKLLNIARMDGEAADAYIDRLVMTMQSLPADERAALEKQLGTILRGVTLSMLTDALRNSAGPDAARLAVMFELARSSGGARGAKPPISSYLQDLIPANLTALPPPVRGVSMAPALPASPLSEAAKTALLMGSGDEQMPRPLSQSQGIGTPSQSASLTPPAASSGNPPIRTASATAPAAQASVPTPAGGSASTTSVAPGAMLAIAGKSDGELPPASAMRPTPPQAQNLSTDVHAVRTTLPEETVPIGRAPAAPLQSADGKAPSALPNPFAAASAKDMEGLLLAALLRSTPAQAQVLDEAIGLPPQALQPQDEQLAKQHAMASPNMPASTKDSAQEDAVSGTMPRHEAAVAHRSGPATELDAALFTQPGPHSAAAAMMAKEGIPLPFVHYPAGEDEHEGDAPPRGRWPSSEGGYEEDSGEGQPDGGSDQEERAAANDEIIDHSLSDGANDDASAGSAESYYLRMSDAS
ncbi:hypothetical protein ASF69_21380 [Rhizobium sp. Leaf311]|uniref:hypothetical protein n=1 Tax=Rhizobium sp. Leaf311 TaxID=1736332 RepID=UPI0007145B3D|nr:hypothetical protein [Rhizobium sp. Leaf311]KQQ49393.1 hypothetical protein ASF69_21380 [Rhizobium sp. Leaf311]